MAGLALRRDNGFNLGQYRIVIDRRSLGLANLAS